MATHKLKVGQKVRVVGNVMSHAYHVGKEYTVGGVNPKADDQYTLRGQGHNDQWWISLKELSCAATREDLRKEREERRRELDEVELKLEFLSQSGTDEFDEDLYKCWQALAVLENGGKSKLEKAKELAKLLKS